MKKRKQIALHLNKKVISNLTSQSVIGGLRRSLSSIFEFHIHN
jgi:hypothetical protein